MQIIKHKEVDMTVDEIFAAVNTNNIPSDVVINITNGDTIVVEPFDKSNIFGIIDDDYETIYFEE